MPNGHGGYPYMGSPLLLLLLIAIVLFAGREGSETNAALVRPVLALALALLFGWRLAYHLHKRQLDAYGGAYESADERRRASRRFRLFAILYGGIAFAVVAGLLHLRRIP
jgi:hypothetical protein